MVDRTRLCLRRSSLRMRTVAIVLFVWKTPYRWLFSWPKEKSWQRFTRAKSKCSLNIQRPKKRFVPDRAKGLVSPATSGRLFWSPVNGRSFNFRPFNFPLICSSSGTVVWNPLEKPKALFVHFLQALISVGLTSALSFRVPGRVFSSCYNCWEGLLRAAWIQCFKIIRSAQYFIYSKSAKVRFWIHFMTTFSSLDKESFPTSWKNIVFSIPKHGHPL